MNQVLLWLKERLELSEITLKSMGLPEPDDDIYMEISQRIIQEELRFNKEDQINLAIQSKRSMNSDQAFFFDSVISAINSNNGGLFCLDAPGGTGKTFVLNALLYAVRGDGFIALATAMSAVASKLLINGTTVHSRFKVPIDIKETSFCLYIFKLK